MYWPGSMFQSTASWALQWLMSRRTSEVITQQSWENELAWNEGRFPRLSPELLDTHQRPESCFLSAQDNLEDLILTTPDLVVAFLKKFSSMVEYKIKEWIIPMKVNPE